MMAHYLVTKAFHLFYTEADNFSIHFL